MICIIVVRRCFCEMGGHYFDLEWGEEPPAKCKVCGSLNWEVAPEIRDAVYIRKGITKVSKKLNPGAKSRARQEQGKRQWRKFRTKEQEQVEAAKGKADD